MSEKYQASQERFKESAFTEERVNQANLELLKNISDQAATLKTILSQLIIDVAKTDFLPTTEILEEFVGLLGYLYVGLKFAHLYFGKLFFIDTFPNIQNVDANWFKSGNESLSTIKLGDENLFAYHLQNDEIIINFKLLLQLAERNLSQVEDNWEGLFGIQLTGIEDIEEFMFINGLSLAALKDFSLGRSDVDWIGIPKDVNYGEYEIRFVLYVIQKFNLRDEYKSIYQTLLDHIS